MTKTRKAHERRRRLTTTTTTTTTLEAIDAMSSDSDNDDNNEYRTSTPDAAAAATDTEWNKALKLRKAIAQGAYDHLLLQPTTTTTTKKSSGGDGGGSSHDEQEQESVGFGVQGSQDEQEQEPEQENGSASSSSNDNDEDEDDDDDGANQDKDEASNNDDDNDEKQQQQQTAGKALLTVTEELVAHKRGMPWAETLDIVSSKLPLNNNNNDDVHDDLQRECAFYTMALDAVQEAQARCRQARVPFARPEDFFAEMVKTDDHMAKVKDRLIYETKKMNAVTQRKANKEQKLRAKEKHANKLAEKARRTKHHLKAVDEWAKSAAASRGGALRDDDDDVYLGRMNQQKGWMDRDGNMQTGPNKKRMAADRKYGHGGKKGRFKQNDPRSMNDMSGFNPRGNFAGGTKAKGGAGANRKGKRARDAARSRR